MFADILKTKTSFLDYENKNLRKVKKIAIFPKGLVLGFGKKPEISPCFYFSQNRPEKCDWRYYRKEKTFLEFENKKLKKPKKKMRFFQGG